MLTFPQELVDEVIDKLAEPEPSRPYAPLDISRYSLVSKSWLDRTQKHHFAHVTFNDPGKMDKWVASIDANNFGVSKHVRTLTLSSIESLEGFQNHIRALTGVKTVQVWDCPLFKSPGQVQILKEGLGKNLVNLELVGTETTSEIMVSLLAGLPELCTLHATSLMVDEPNQDAPAPPAERIPFFESGKGHFKVSLGSPARSGQFSWVPPTAKLSRVGLAADDVPYNLEFVNRLVSSSGETLTDFILGEEPGEPPPGNINLSSCTSLTTVRFPVITDNSWSFASFVLPSITSSRFSKVVLGVQGFCTGEFSSESWEEVQLILGRLAKRLKTMYGIRITVALDADYCEEEFDDLLFDNSLMSSLRGEVDIEVFNGGYQPDDGPFPDPDLAVVWDSYYATAWSYSILS